MAYGYNNKVLFVDLTTGEMHIEEPGDRLFRMYLGGDGIGTYYAMREIPAHADPLGPENRLIISTGIATGAPVAATSRVMANFKSPVTGGIGSSQGGGAFGTRMKYSGFDALVISGKADHPVYLYLEGGKAELRDASHLWGKTNKEYTEILASELGKSACPFGIGPAGEKMHVYASISTGLTHFCGRTGTGAVMGSKNLKCIVAQGAKPMFEYADPDKLKLYFKQSVDKAKAGEYEWWQTQGTGGVPGGKNESGMLPTKNYTEGVFELGDKIDTNEWIAEGIYAGNHACLGCGIACKQRVKAAKAEKGFDLDPAYGAPEYETIGAFGSNLLIGNVVAICKANEICNANGLDTISVGGTIAMIMECGVNGLLTAEQCYGVEPKWGSVELVMTLLEKSIERAPGLGNAMADGLDACAAWIGKGAEKYAFSTKNNPVPMHAPQAVQSMALNYSIHEYVDHQTVDMDKNCTPDNFSPDAYYPRGIYAPMKFLDLTEDKVKFIYYTHIQFSLTNCIGVCDFGWNSGTAYDMVDTVGIINAAAGWNTNQWELYKSVERVLVLQRLFNEREGFTAKNDTMPERILDLPYSEGPKKGAAIDSRKLLHLRELYYDMAGMDAEGHVRYAKALEMDLKWAKDMVDAAK